MMGELKNKIAILGATSHIAKGLIYYFSSKTEYELFLFARSRERVHNFLTNIYPNKIPVVNFFDEFYKYKYNAVINCVGISEPVKLKNEIQSIFRLTEYFDNLILEYLVDNQDTLYVNFSSGAVYGTDFHMSVEESTPSKWNVNNITEADFYGIAKLNSEAKHRSLKNLKIIDLRIFSYFSRFINLDANFLISEIISCIKESRQFITGRDDIARDYIHPKDLFSLIERCMQINNLNDAIDAYSLKPLKKFELLDFFTKEYGLNCMVKDYPNVASLTGKKDNYYTNNHKAERIGYLPQFTSMDCIFQESKHFFNKK